MQAIKWCHFRWPWVTPDLGFKDTVVLKGEYLQSDAFYRHSYYTVVQKNDTKLVSITSPNNDRFSKFFHCYTQQEICNKDIITDPATP